MGRVAVINTGLCNLDSVSRAIEECGGSPVVTDDPEDLAQATQIVLPGVGAFPAAMDRLVGRRLTDEMTEQVFGHGIPFLGICLGMQLMADRSFEHRETDGLGWIAGDVRPIEPRAGERRIHIGWNEVLPVRDSVLFNDIDSGHDFYFVHSFVLQTASPADTLATTPYGGGFTSAVARDHVFGVQFHPEKSQRLGLTVLRNFLAI